MHRGESPIEVFHSETCQRVKLTTHPEEVLELLICQSDRLWAAAFAMLKKRLRNLKAYLVLHILAVLGEIVAGATMRGQWVRASSVKYKLVQITDYEGRGRSAHTTWNTSEFGHTFINVHKGPYVRPGFE